MPHLKIEKKPSAELVWTATFHIPDVLIMRMSDGFICSEGPADFGVEAAFIGVQEAFLRDVIRNDLGDSELVCSSDVPSADVAATLDQGDDRTLVARPRVKARRAD
jgi:hypothetical protein